MWTSSFFNSLLGVVGKVLGKVTEDRLKLITKDVTLSVGLELVEDV